MFRYPAVLSFIAYLAAALLLGWPAVSGHAALGPDAVLDGLVGHTPFFEESRAHWSDIAPIVLDYPRDLMFARGLSAGRLDNWNPWSALGAPLWAEQGGPFFPLKAVFYLWPTRSGYNLFLLLRLAVAGFGSYFLARSRGLAPVPSFLSGLLFELSGSMIAHFSFGSASAYCVLPWALLAAGALAGARLRWSAAVATSAITIAAALSGGHPTISFLVVFAWGVAFLANLVLSLVRYQNTWLHAGRVALGGVAALILGIALSAPAIMPFLELKDQAESYKETSYGEAIWEWSREQSVAGALVALYAPMAFADIREKAPAMWPWPFSSMVPPLALVLGIAGLFLGVLDAGLVAVAVCGIFLAVFPREFNPFHSFPFLTHVLPLYSWPLVVLPLTQAAGAAMAQLGTRRGLRCVLVALVLVLVGFITLGFVSNDVAGIPVAALLFAALRRSEVMMPVAVLWLLTAVVFLAGALAPRLWRAVWYGSAVGALAVLQAWFIVHPLVLEPPAQVIAASGSELALWVRDRMLDGHWRFHGNSYPVFHPMSSVLWEGRDFRGLSALPIWRVLHFMQLIDKNQWAAFQTVESVAHPLLDLAAVRYLLVAGLPPPDDLLTVRRAGFHDISVFENHGALSRARIVRRTIVVPDATTALRTLKGLVQDKLHAGDTDLLHSVVLEAIDDHALPPKMDDSASLSFDERLEIQATDDPDQVELAVHLEQPGVLILADTYYPGWHAYVDGGETTIYPANVAFRAISVPAGDHHVVFSYQPHPLTTGAWLSLAAGFVVGLLAIPHRLWSFLTSRIFAF